MNYARTLGLVVALLAFGTTAGAAESGPKPETTLKNLKTTLQAEVTASHRYDLFAQKADDEGYKQVADLFRAASKSESIHADNHKAAISKLGGTVPEVSPEQVTVGSTRQNLELPIKGEKDESEDTYPSYIREAKREGAQVAVDSFQNAMKSEKQHLKLFEQALKDLGHNRAQDYYVQKNTGETVAIAKNRRLSDKDYMKIS